VAPGEQSVDNSFLTWAEVIEAKDRLQDFALGVRRDDGEFVGARGQGEL
jgi:hypothetical protein